MWLFNMDYTVAYTLGYTLSCISPSVIVPCLVSLLERGYGKDKGIPTAIIAAGTFDDILTIINNGICASIAFTKIDYITGEPKESILHDVLSIFWQIFIGMLVGLGAGLLGWFLTKIPSSFKYTMELKFCWCVFNVFAFPFLADLDGYPHAKFIAALFFGYSSYRVWGEAKPSAELYKFWFFLQPCLFGTVGA
jgi:solute carrier family 9B (sodium/hydrogen exchanger), member 1/2